VDVLRQAMSAFSQQVKLNIGSISLTIHSGIPFLCWYAYLSYKHTNCVLHQGRDDVEDSNQLMKHDKAI
jgi:Trk-type K+ transport system membrane component